MDVPGSALDSARVSRDYPTVFALGHF
jgi:hypothetical protein